MSWKDITVRYVKELMKPKPISEIIEKEMREAIIKKLEAESAVEYARSIVQYNQQRIERLEKRLHEHSDGGARA
jgi:fibronectin type 3 domain-containing protein